MVASRVVRRSGVIADGGPLDGRRIAVQPGVYYFRLEVFTNLTRRSHWYARRLVVRLEGKKTVRREVLAYIGCFDGNVVPPGFGFLHGPCSP